MKLKCSINFMICGALFHLSVDVQPHPMNSYAGISRRILSSMNVKCSAMTKGEAENGIRVSFALNGTLML